jgi:hypothetical protein
VQRRRTPSREGGGRLRSSSPDSGWEQAQLAEAARRARDLALRLAKTSPGGQRWPGMEASTHVVAAASPPEQALATEAALLELRAEQLEAALEVT